MITWLVAAALGFAGGIVFRIWFKAWKRRKIAAARKIELPNSAYSSLGVRNQEDRERWGSIELDHLHPLNQEEVQRLLFVVDADGIKALSPRDRLFLDNMTIPRMG